MADEMRAWRIHEFGDADALRLDLVPRPAPAADEVLVRIAATSINPVDYKTRDGDFPPVEKDDLPIILGRDVAGTVEADGHGFSAGDRVYGMPAFGRGTYADYVAMKPPEMTRLPDTIELEAAAGMPLAALTAWQGLFDKGDLKKGERVLILGAPGGVGHLAVQFAKHAGATVLATGRGRDRAFLAELGVERMIDTETEALDVIGGPVDLVFDLLGGAAQQDAWDAIKENGRFVSTLEAPDAGKAGKPNVRTAQYMAEPNGDQLARIATLLADGKIRLVEQRRFDFADLPTAHRALEGGHSQGKIILRCKGVSRATEFSERQIPASISTQAAGNESKMKPPTRTLSIAAIAGVAAATGLVLALRRGSGGNRDDAPGRTTRSGTSGTPDIAGKTVTIRNPGRNDLYDHWRDFANLPAVMENVESVEILSSERSRWTIKAPAGDRVELICRITEDRPGEIITWASEPASDITTEGRIRFLPAAGDRGTRVELVVAYDPPAGKVGKTIAKLFQREPAIQARRDLRRFKMLMETGEIATSNHYRKEG